MAQAKRVRGAVTAKAGDWAVVLAGIPDLPLGDEALPAELAAARPSGVWPIEAGAASAARCASRRSTPSTTRMPTGCWASPPRSRPRPGRRRWGRS